MNTIMSKLRKLIFTCVISGTAIFELLENAAYAADTPSITALGKCHSYSPNECEKYNRDRICFVEELSDRTSACRDICFLIKNEKNCKQAITAEAKKCHWNQAKKECYDPAPPVPAEIEILSVECKHFKSRNRCNESADANGEECVWCYSKKTPGKCYARNAESDEINAILKEPDGTLTSIGIS